MRSLERSLEDSVQRGQEADPRAHHSPAVGGILRALLRRRGLLGALGHALSEDADGRAAQGNSERDFGFLSVLSFFFVAVVVRSPFLFFSFSLDKQHSTKHGRLHSEDLFPSFTRR